MIHHTTNMFSSHAKRNGGHGSSSSCVCCLSSDVISTGRTRSKFQLKRELRAASQVRLVSEPMFTQFLI
jgi:hypothetical protein